MVEVEAARVETCRGGMAGCWERRIRIGGWTDGSRHRPGWQL